MGWPTSGNRNRTVRILEVCLVAESTVLCVECIALAIVLPGQPVQRAAAYGNPMAVRHGWRSADVAALQGAILNKLPAVPAIEKRRRAVLERWRDSFCLRLERARDSWTKMSAQERVVQDSVLSLEAILIPQSFIAAEKEAAQTRKRNVAAAREAVRERIEGLAQAGGHEIVFDDSQLLFASKAGDITREVAARLP